LFISKTGMLMTKVQESLERAIGGTYDHVRPEDFKPRLDRVADAVGWPQIEDRFPPDSFHYPERGGTSND
jgi:hypothetical protein